MSERDARTYLGDIVSGCGGIIARSAGKTLRDYQEDESFRLICERLFTIIGEACVQLRRLAPDLARRIDDTEKIVAFRNTLIHGYFGITDEVIWNIIEVHVPVLERQAQSLLGELD